MRSLLALAVLLLAAMPVAAGAEELSSGAAVAPPVLVPGGSLWSPGGDHMVVRPGGRDVVLPPPGNVPAGAYGDLEVRRAGATALAYGGGTVAVQRWVYSCYPAGPGEATTSCVAPIEVLAGPVAGPFVRVSAPHACRRPQGSDTTAVAGGRVVVVEAGVECRGDVEPPLDTLVAVDPVDPAQRLVLRGGRGLSVRAAGDLVASSSRRRRSIVVTDVRSGRHLRTVRAATAGAAHFGTWDIQRDGTVAAGLIGPDGDPYRLIPVVFPPRGEPRRLPGRIGRHVQVERDRVAAHWPRGFDVVDLRGRSRRLGAERPEGAFDFDGRRATWLRVRVLDGPRPCPSDPGPSDCVSRPGRSEFSLRLATVAR